MLASNPQICVSFEIPIEVRRLVRGWGGRFQGRGDRRPWYEGLKKSSETGRVKLRKGGKESGKGK